jgi:ApbE superfamily uncharacterized protein (UPF0280 family)
MMAQRLHGERLHLQHGPIDVVLRAWGDPRDVAAAERAAAMRFATMLDELVAELPVLRRAVDSATVLRGPVARRMLAACLPFARRGAWLTAMASVAGAVADELMATMLTAAPGLQKAFVNDGGDIAMFVGPGQVLTLGLAIDPTTGLRPTFDGTLALTADSAIRGGATSGRHGRSFSLGVADAVTVLAKDAATADAAATLIANAVNLHSPTVTRAPAVSLDPDSDLGDRLVTTGVGVLTPAETSRALDAGLAVAEGFARAGLIGAAALRLRGEARVTGAHLLQDHAA